MAYTVVKSHFAFNGKVYNRGDKVELDSDLANFYINQGVVISSEDPKLSHEVDGLFDSLKKEIEDLKKTIGIKDSEIARLTSDLELKAKVIAELDATKNRGRK